MTASESKCKVILPPEVFDFKQQPEPPVVFLAGAIDMGKASDWQKEVIESLADIPCVALNPRRKDWDSSWKQEIGNEKFREQVEWELKGLEQANLIALCFTKDSKAPISFLEMGLHISEGRMIVHCPEGFYRKGNVDIVCARYGVPVLQDFEDFKREVKRRLGEPVMRKPVTASDRIAWRIIAKEFVMRMNMASNTKKLQDAFDGDLAYFEKWCNPKRLDKLGYKTAKDAWEDNPVLEYKITGWAKKASEGHTTAARKVHLEPKGLEGIEKCSECGKQTRYWLKGNQVPLCPECAKKDGKKTAGVETCRFGQIPLGGRFKFKGHVWERQHGKFGLRVDQIGEGQVGWPFNVNDVVEPVKGHTAAASNHKDFDTKKEALKFLEDHALMSVGWKEGSKEKEACYWNGKVHITEADPKKRSAGGYEDIPGLCREHRTRYYFDDGEGLIGVTNHRGGISWYRWVSDGYSLVGETATPQGAQRRHVAKTAGMGDTHPFGSPLRGRPDYGERDGEVGEVYGLKLPSEGIMTSNDHTAAAIVDIRKDAKEIAQRVVDENKPFMVTVSGTARFLTLHKTYSEAKAWAVRWEREVCMLPERRRMRDDEKFKAGLIPYVSMAADFTPIRLEINRILSSRVSTVSDSMRVRIVADRIVSTVKEFTGRK